MGGVLGAKSRAQVSGYSKERIGAGEEDRTLDIHLGNPAGTGFLVLTHNYSKPKNVVKAES
jgi:hypothetical protein